MSNKINYKKMQSIAGYINLAYYICLIVLVISLVCVLILPFIGESAYKIENHLGGWTYQLELAGEKIPLRLETQGTISHRMIQSSWNRPLKVLPIIMSDIIVSRMIALVLTALSLYKLRTLARHMLTGKSPFQTNFLMTFKVYLRVIFIYSAFSNTLLGLLFALLAKTPASIPIDPKWEGLFICLVGYMVLEMIKHGRYLQESYDTTL